MFSYDMPARNGRHKIIEIEVVKNGWIVTYYPKMESFNSEDYQKRQQEFLDKQAELDKERLAKSLKEQAASMQIAGEAMMKIKESWQEDNNFEDNFKKIDELAEKISEMHPTKNDNYLMRPPAFLASGFLPEEPISMIFIQKEELLKFVAESL